jgi:5-methylcytosine-specific restriction endonuclease McrA
MVDEQILPGEEVAAHMTIEHLIATSVGGTDDLENLVLACFQCNNDRGDQPGEYLSPWRVEFNHEAVLDQAHRGEG